MQSFHCIAWFFPEICSILCFAPHKHTLWYHQYLICILVETWISLGGKKILPKETRHSSLFWKAFSISLFFIAWFLRIFCIYAKIGVLVELCFFFFMLTLKGILFAVGVSGLYEQAWQIVTWQIKRDCSKSVGVSGLYNQNKRGKSLHNK